MQGAGGFYRAMLSLLVRAPISVLWISLTLSDRLEHLQIEMLQPIGTRYQWRYLGR